MKPRSVGGIVACAILFAHVNCVMAATVPGELYVPATATVVMGTATANAVVNSVNRARFGTLREQAGVGAASLASGLALAAACPESASVGRVWGTSIYSRTDAGARGGQIGSGYVYNFRGVALGYERVVGDLVMGGAVTYGSGSYNARGVVDDVKSRNYGATLYAGYYDIGPGFFAEAFGGYNYGDNTVRVHDGAGWNRATPHTGSYWLGATMGYDARLNECLRLTPSAGLLWLNASTSRHRLGGVRYGTARENGLLLPIDLAATYTAFIDETSSVQLSVGGGYAYNFKNDRPGVDVVSVAAPALTHIRGVSQGRHNWNAVVGAKYIRNRFDVGVDYRFDRGGRRSAHAVSATFGMTF